MREEVDMTISVLKGGFLVTVPKMLDVDGDGVQEVVYDRIIVTSPGKAVSLIKEALETFKFSA